MLSLHSRDRASLRTGAPGSEDTAVIAAATVPALTERATQTSKNQRTTRGSLLGFSQEHISLIAFPFSLGRLEARSHTGIAAGTTGGTCY